MRLFSMTLMVGAAAASSVRVFLGMSLAFGAALAHLDAVLHSGSQLYRCLQDELDSSRRKTESDRKAMEAWLHDLQNAIVALQAAGAVLRSAPEGWSGAHVAVADSVTAELAWIQSFVDSARQLAPADLDLEDTLAPVIVAERVVGARVHLDVSGTSAFAGRVALIRVVQNVLANARNYAPQSPVEDAATAHEHGVEVTIGGRGPGIPPSERATVFEREARGSSSAGAPGNGLGLYVAQSLLESMGGTIALHDGSPGCRFVITLPRASDRGCCLESPRAERGAGGPPGQPDHLARAV